MLENKKLSLKYRESEKKSYSGWSRLKKKLKVVCVLVSTCISNLGNIDTWQFQDKAILNKNIKSSNFLELKSVDLLR